MKNLLQGLRTQIDEFQTDIFSWLNGTLIKRKLFLEIWCKNQNINFFLWSQSLIIKKNQWVFHLIFASFKTKFLASTLQPFLRLWKNQCYHRDKVYLIWKHQCSPFMSRRKYKDAKINLFCIPIKETLQPNLTLIYM